MDMSTVKILGIDPGINNTGWCIMKFNPATLGLQVTTFGTIHANELAKAERKEVKKYGNVVALEFYRTELEELIASHHPDFIASEDAFYNPKMPMAFLSLKLCINTLQRLLYLRFRKTLHLIPAMVAKQAVRGSHRSNNTKAVIQECIHHLPDLSIKSTKQNPVEKMVEHEADSIAIAYAFAKNMLPDLLMQK